MSAASGLASEKVRQVPQPHTHLGGRLGAGAPGKTFFCPQGPGAMSKSGQDAGGSQRTVSRELTKLGAPLQLEV